MKSKTEFVCSECGFVSPKWNGKCPSCGEWNTLNEEERTEPTKLSLKSSGNRITRATPNSFSINSIPLSDQIRSKTGIGEFDRTLGGGIVSGSVVLISGEPGIGKSTLLLQICGILGKKDKLLYVSGEESPSQLKLRAERLGVSSDNLLILAETDINEVLEEIDIVHPSVVVIDSIQTMYDSTSTTSAGSVTQVKNTAAELIRKAKGDDIAILIVGHVNKDGAIAGPKVLEHMVDTVLYFEGEKQHSYRILRAVKNRFGSTNEIGIFEMEEEGLFEVENPSEYLLSQRPVNVSGNCTLCIMEGTRPILAEIQALVTPTVYPSPKRMATGFDYNRMSLIAAVLEKRMGLRFSAQDVYVNVVGGLHIDEPASDLATAFALISGIKDIPVDERLVAMGELGLSGECRAISGIEQRVRECARLGFKKIVIPYRNFSKLKQQNIPKDVEIIPVKSIFDSLKLFSN
jgi:DNA repair protein RadA